MLVLAVIALLATAAPDALPRVPGTRLRLGMAESQLLQLGSFPEVKSTETDGVVTRRGSARYFGVPGELTCTIRDRRLERVRFEAAGVSRHSQDYVDGQLRRMGLARGCERDVSGDRVCTWDGPGYRVSTRMRRDSLVVRAVRWPPPAGTAIDPPAGGPVTAARGARPPTPGTAPSTATPAPRPAGGTRSTAQATTPPGPATPPAAPAPVPPATPAARDTNIATVRPVAMLAETLTISLTSRNSPDVWPRVVSSPPLDYPPAARRESIQGVVWVMAVVEPDGRVDDAWIESSIPELDTAALAWISRARFAPCEREGRPCRFHVRVAIRFTLY